jgi:pyruvate kinase
MSLCARRTKIVATLGPASSTPEVIRQLIAAGLDVARLNFSHGSYDDHARTIRILRDLSLELDKPVTLLQDLQGPKVRVGRLPGDAMELKAGDTVMLVPEGRDVGAGVIPVDYPLLQDQAAPGMQVLLDDGLLELEVRGVGGMGVACRVVEGGVLKSRKGVNFPGLNLCLPSLTDKDLQDLKFGLKQGVDWVSLSFVRSETDICILKDRIKQMGYDVPVIAKIEKPQALQHLEAIVEEAQGVMVARGDLGVEVSPEKVPMLQKRIIELCNQKGRPVITATQMLESMIVDSRPTRAEASDVANAIIDGTDAVMLSGETAVGAHPVKAVEMMARIACEVEGKIPFKSYLPAQHTGTHALSEAVNAIERVLIPRCIVLLTTTGFTAQSVASQRPKAPVVALTQDAAVYHRLNLVWGVQPLLVEEAARDFESLVALAERTLLQKGLAAAGDTILVLGGVPPRTPLGTNFIKLHEVK